MASAYIIWVPPFSKSAGVRALYALADKLMESGYEVFLFCKKPNKLGYSYITKRELATLKKTAIVIYPEIVKGNPLKIKKVVRWVLYFPGVLGGYKKYSKKEMLFTWDPLYYRAPELRVSLIDTSLFYNDNSIEKREIVCFSYKNKEIKKYPNFLKDAIHITMKYPSSRSELAELLRKTKVLYSFDHCSMILDEASICGADVKIVMEDGSTQEYHPKLEFYRETDLDQQFDNFIGMTQPSKFWKIREGNLFSLLKRLLRILHD